MAKRLIQREADAKAADQDPHARLTAGIERCTDQQALGGAIARVHQEHTVVDDLVVRLGTPQHQLTPGRHHTLHHDRAPAQAVFATVHGRLEH